MKDTSSQLEEEIAKPGFWDDNIRAQEITKELSDTKNTLSRYEDLRNEISDTKELYQLMGEVEDITEEIDSLKKRLDELEIQFILDDKDDKKDAILSIHPGAGGTEACDWAEMLLRMYLRWVERRNFSSNILDLEPGDVAGIKDVTIEVKGRYAYGYLKPEIGIHRLVRISPFDSGARRHTSFASCFVYPVVEDTKEFEIKDSELRMGTFRSSGPGGQNVNKLNTAVRITHIPTGIVVTCQSERSQYQNRVNALKVLRSKLYEMKKEEEREKLQKLEKKKTEIGWGREIRSYVFHPYKLIKDHRTELRTSDVDRVMDGDLDEFIMEWLLTKNQ